jgi:hypothetical protein
MENPCAFFPQTKKITYNIPINKRKGMTLMLKFKKGQYQPKHDENTVKSGVDLTVKLENAPVFEILNYFDSKEEEVLSVVAKNLLSKTLYCSCGNVFGNKEVCPNCGKKAEIYLTLPLGKKVEEKIENGSYKMIITGPDYGISVYNNHLDYSVINVTLEMNLETGVVTYNNGVLPFSQKKYVRGEYNQIIFADEVNTRYGDINAMLGDFYSHYDADWIKKRQRRVISKGIKSFRFVKGQLSIREIPIKYLNKFYNECFKLRGIKFIKPVVNVKEVSEMDSLSALLEYPLLENLPFNKFSRIPKVLSEVIRNSNEKEIYNKIFHHPSAKVRNLIHSDAEVANFQMLFGSIIQDPNNQIKILEHIKNASYRGYKEIKLFEIYSNLDLKLFHQGISYFKSFQTNENVFINRLISSYKNFSDNALIDIVDIGRMIAQIKKYKPDFEVKNIENCKKMHNELSRAFRKYSSGNKVIEHNEIEKTFEKTVGQLEFYLPKETYELIDCGEELGICVGSYGSSAVNKNCTILFLKECDEIKVCMELRKNIVGNAFKLVQAKTNRNQKPEIYNDLIIEFCKENNIEIDTWDIKTEELKEIKQRHQNWAEVLGNQIFNLA